MAILSGDATLSFSFQSGSTLQGGASVAQWVQHQLADLAVPSSTTGGGNLFSHKRDSIASSLSFSSSNCPEMTEMPLKMTYNRKQSSHPSFTTRICSLGNIFFN